MHGVMDDKFGMMLMVMNIIMGILMLMKGSFVAIPCFMVAIAIFLIFKLTKKKE